LSLNRVFLKVPRAKDDPGKGCYWAVDENAANPASPNSVANVKGKSATRVCIQ